MTDLVVDTSAAVAILRAEPEADRLLRALDGADVRLMSSATLVELALVLEGRYGAPARGLADRFVRDAGIELAPLEQQQATHAIEGWRRFGRGHHPAALNLGECFTYGLAIATDWPVLCVGDDFPRTDVAVVPLGQ